MKRRIEDLKLKPFAPDAAQEADAAKAQRLLTRIEEMVASDKFYWAQDTLDGIYKTVEEQGRVTEAQVRTVDNIAAARGW